MGKTRRRRNPVAQELHEERDGKYRQKIVHPKKINKKRLNNRELMEKYKEDIK